MIAPESRVRAIELALVRRVVEVLGAVAGGLDHDDAAARSRPGSRRSCRPSTRPGGSGRAGRCPGARSGARRRRAAARRRASIASATADAADRRREHALDVGRDARRRPCRCRGRRPRRAPRCRARASSRIVDRRAADVRDAIAGEVLVRRVPAALDVGEPHARAAHAAPPRGRRVDAVRRRPEIALVRLERRRVIGQRRRRGARGRRQRDLRRGERLVDARIAGEARQRAGRRDRAGTARRPARAARSPAESVSGRWVRGRGSRRVRRRAAARRGAVDHDGAPRLGVLPSQRTAGRTRAGAAMTR